MNWSIINFCVLVSLSVWFFIRFLTASQQSKNLKEVEKKILDLDGIGKRNPQLEKIYKYSSIKSFQNFLIKRNFSTVLALMLKRSQLPISVSVFLLGSVVIFVFAQSIASVNNFGFFLSTLFGIGCGITPFLYIRYRNNKYLDRFSEYLPDSLSIMGNSIKVGHTLEAAIDAVAQTAPYPICDEFRAAKAEMRLGQALQIALRHLHTRINLVETKIFVTGVSVHQELGGNLSELLANLEETIRQRFALKREIKALSAQGIMSMYVVTASPFLMALIWWFNDRKVLIDFVNDPAGRFLIMVGICLQITAYFWMKRIVTLKE